MQLLINSRKKKHILFRTLQEFRKTHCSQLVAVFESQFKIPGWVSLHLQFSHLGNVMKNESMCCFIISLCSCAGAFPYGKTCHSIICYFSFISPFRIIHAFFKVVHVCKSQFLWNSYLKVLRNFLFEKKKRSIGSGRTRLSLLCIQQGSPRKSKGRSRLPRMVRTSCSSPGRRVSSRLILKFAFRLWYLFYKGYRQIW